MDESAGSLRNGMTFYIIGNCLSFVAAIFTALSSWAKDRWHIYFYQVLQCVFLSVASFFFCSYAGIVTLAVCAIRNYLLAIDRFGKRGCVISVVLMLVLGILFNNNGYIGIIVIAANVIYTIGTFFCKRELTIKINIMVDLLLWMIYEILILDISSFVADFIGFIVAVLSLIRLKKGTGY